MGLRLVLDEACMFYCFLFLVNLIAIEVKFDKWVYWQHEQNLQKALNPVTNQTKQLSGAYIYALYTPTGFQQGKLMCIKNNWRTATYRDKYFMWACQIDHNYKRCSSLIGTFRQRYWVIIWCVHIYLYALDQLVASKAIVVNWS